MSQAADHDARTKKELKLVQFITNENSYFIEDGNKTIGFILNINNNPFVTMFNPSLINSKVIE